MGALNLKKPEIQAALSCEFNKKRSMPVTQSSYLALRQQLDLLSNTPVDLTMGIGEIGDNPVIFLAPRSHFGIAKIPGLLKKYNVIAVVDDFSTEEYIFGIKKWSIFDFMQNRKKYDSLFAIDFSRTPFALQLFDKLCESYSVSKYSFMQALNFHNQPIIYETAEKVREVTLRLMNSYLKLVEKLDDLQSRITLLSILCMRLSGDRSYASLVEGSWHNEYFGLHFDRDTFCLNDHEDYVDIGAYDGSIIYKFLAHTHYRFNSITAYEPDKINFRKILKINLLSLKNVKLRQYAVGEQAGVLRFNETGTTGSAVSDKGETEVKVVKLDDELEKISFLKIDAEGPEAQILRGGQSIIKSCMPKIATACYHYAHDILDIVKEIENISPDYKFRLRHYSSYYGDTCLYASTSENFWF